MNVLNNLTQILKEYMPKDTNINTSKAKRYNAGKPKMSMVPLDVIREVAKVFTYGELKYDRDNWKNGFEWSSILDSALRHVTAWQSGEDIDLESGLNHISMAITNLIMLQWYILHPNLGKDDRWKNEK